MAAESYTGKRTIKYVTVSARVPQAIRDALYLKLQGENLKPNQFFKNAIAEKIGQTVSPIVSYRFEYGQTKDSLFWIGIHEDGSTLNLAELAPETAEKLLIALSSGLKIRKNYRETRAHSSTNALGQKARTKLVKKLK